MALDLITHSSSATASSDKNLPYPLNVLAVEEINDILIQVAPLRTPSPTVLAWGIILQTVRMIAQSNRESRELRQSGRAADKYGAVDSSDTDGPERGSIRGLYSLRRRSSTGSDTSQSSTLLEEINDKISISAVDGDPIAYLAKNAVDGGKVFDIVTAIAVEYCTPFGFEHRGKPGQKMRGILIDLIRASLSFVEYQPALMMATLAVLTGSERYWDTLDRHADSSGTDPAASFFEDGVLKRSLWLTSLSRFPYETTPFLLLSQALAFENNGKDPSKPAIWSMLDDVDTFACRFTSEFQAYGTTRTQEEADYIELKASFMFTIGPDPSNSQLDRYGPGRPMRALAKSSQSSKFHEVLPGTIGELLNSSKPFVVSWHQDYSALTYMGKVLQCASADPDLCINTSTAQFSSEIVAEIISLTTFMLSSAAKGASPGQQNSITAVESAQSMLGNMSDGLDRNQDIISVIFNIFENELYKHRKPSEDAEPVDVLVQCIQFSFALLPLMPDRVWPFLGRSGLLGIGKDESQLSAVIASQEMILGHYDFLLGCIRLFDALIEDVVLNVIPRKAPTKAVARFTGSNALGAGVSQNTMEQVLASLTRTMVEIFESTMNWRFVVQEDRMEINFRLCLIFTKILNYCYIVNDSLDLSQKLVGALAPAAEYIIDVFLSPSDNDVTVLPLLHIFGEGIATPSTTLPTRGLQNWSSQVRSALNLTTMLIQVNGLLQRPPSQVEKQMFNAASVLAKVYAAHESYKLPVVDLFDAIIRSAGSTGQQPPSLLGHLGQETASHFLEVLSMLDQPLNDDMLSSAIWRLLSAVVSKRQQWFAIFILTGSTPRESFKDNKQDSNTPKSRRSEPILNIALDKLSNIERLDPQTALSMLEFVALAADFWPWVLTTMEQHPQFIKAISEFAARLGSMTATSREKSYKTSADYNSTQMTSYVADIMAMYTHHTQQMNNQKFAKNLVQHLFYLIKNAIVAPSYNTSLHANLRQNFALKFPSCSLTDFKRTTIKKSYLGDSYFYDLNLMNKMLAYEPAWTGRKGQGFAEEVKRANFNLSVVESQVVSFNTSSAFGRLLSLYHRTFFTAGSRYWSSLAVL